MTRLVRIFLLSVQLIVSANSRQVNQEPLLINADNGIECFDNSKICVATKNVKVTKGPLTLYCDQLTAKLRQKSPGRNEIYFLHAKGHVKFYGVSGDKAFSQEATYDMDEKKLTLYKTHPDQPDPEVFRGLNMMQAKSFKVFLNKKNEVEKAVAYGQSQLDIRPQNTRGKEKTSQIRAIIYPNSLNNAKRGDDKQRSKSKS